MGPCGRLHTMTSSTLRLRPVGGVARVALECHRLAPLVPRPVNADAGSFLETFVRGPDVGRMKLAQTRAHRSGYAKRRAEGALGRLHQLCAGLCADVARLPGCRPAEAAVWGRPAAAAVAGPERGVPAPHRRTGAGCNAGL